MVHAAFRGRTLGYADALYACAAREARRAGARFLLLNCTPALAPMYEAKGFVRYKPCVWDGGMGLQVPMALVLDDLPSLVSRGHLIKLTLPLRLPWLTMPRDLSLRILLFRGEGSASREELMRVSLRSARAHRLLRPLS